MFDVDVTMRVSNEAQLGAQLFVFENPKPRDAVAELAALNEAVRVRDLKITTLEARTLRGRLLAFRRWLRGLWPWR